jgi:hypothetical protein
MPTVTVSFERGWGVETWISQNSELKEGITRGARTYGKRYPVVRRALGAGRRWLHAPVCWLASAHCDNIETHRWA